MNVTYKVSACAQFHYADLLLNQNDYSDQPVLPQQLVHDYPGPATMFLAHSYKVNV